MGLSVAGRIRERIPEAERLYYRLILVTGRSRSGKTTALQAAAQELGAPLLNLNLMLSERIIGLSQQQRALHTGDVLDELLTSVNHPLILLDNVEVLSDPDLRQDPLRLLQSRARTRTLIVAWGGEVDGADLTYAVPGHPEYRRYPRPEAILVPTQMGG